MKVVVDPCYPKKLIKEFRQCPHRTRWTGLEKRLMALDGMIRSSSTILNSRLADQSTSQDLANRAIENIGYKMHYKVRGTDNFCALTALRSILEYWRLRPNHSPTQLRQRKIGMARRTIPSPPTETSEYETMPDGHCIPSTRHGEQ
jgi:hypothetical protein